MAGPVIFHALRMSQSGLVAKLDLGLLTATQSFNVMLYTYAMLITYYVNLTPAAPLLELM